MDRISKEARKRNMSRVRNKDTDIEIQLCKLLWKNKLRYRKHYGIMGKPDIAFPGYRIAIFCDGDFWHGKNFAREGKKYNDFWFEKISLNIKRDRFVTISLEKKNWKVIRFWKDEIKDNPNNCLATVLKVINDRNIQKILTKNQNIITNN
jgi:DNA mismatch endonuclease (patch repair protein)